MDLINFSIKKTLIVISILMLFYHCKKDSCPNFPNFTNIDSCDICEKNIEIIDIGCMDLENRDWVINDDSTYYARFEPDQPMNQEFCSKYELPKIDFEKKTLLITFTDIGGCSQPNFLYKLSKDTVNKCYTLTIDGWQDAHCTAFWGTTHELLVPKIPKNYYVNFKYNRHTCF